MDHDWHFNWQLDTYVRNFARIKPKKCKSDPGTHTTDQTFLQCHSAEKNGVMAMKDFKVSDSQK